MHYAGEYRIFFSACIRVWIGTEHGLFRLDKVSGNIVADEYPELADCNIAVILCDTGNGIWIGGDKGLFRKNALDRNFHPVPISNSAGRPVKAVTSIIKDDKLNLCLYIKKVIRLLF